MVALDPNERPTLSEVEEALSHLDYSDTEEATSHKEVPKPKLKGSLLTARGKVREERESPKRKSKLRGSLLRD